MPRLTIRVVREDDEKEFGAIGDVLGGGPVSALPSHEVSLLGRQEAL